MLKIIIIRIFYSFIIQMKILNEQIIVIYSNKAKQIIKKDVIIALKPSIIYYIFKGIINNLFNYNI